MSIGVYGTTRPADVRISDIDVFYNYCPNRGVMNTDMFRLESSDVLTQINMPDDEVISGNENILEGLYNLTLPATIFNKIGIYTIYIKPKTIVTSIIDCNVLSSLPSVRGIVIDTTRQEIPEEFKTNNALQGYRIEYINDDGTKLRNTVRYVVTSNRVSPTTGNNSNTNQTTVRYKFDDGGTNLFLQLTPSSSSDVKPNAKQFIGKPNQKILISNTFFSPVAIEVEMVANTIDSLANIIAGEQIKDVDNGKLTYYDEDRNIIKQFDLYQVKDVMDGSLFEVKEKTINIDNSQDFNEITKNL